MNQLIDFVNSLTENLKKRKDYDLIQAWMALFLRAHGDIITENKNIDALLWSLNTWLDVENSEKTKLNELIGYCNGIINFLKID